MTFYLLMGFVAASVTFILSLLMTNLGRRYRLYPKIRERDVHTRPTPRLGGIAMFCGIAVTLAVAAQIPFFSIVFANPTTIYAILGAALIIVLIGVADDLFDLDWMIKLAGQILTGGLLAWQGVAISSLPIGGLTVGSSQMSLLLTVLAVVLVMNAVNFIDGLDGLVAGVAIIANGVFFLYSYLLVNLTSPYNYFNLASLLSVVLVGACAGFLPLNWHPAKLFMGDSGAMLVGLLMATSAIAVTGQVDPIQMASVGRATLIPAFLPILLPFAILIVPLLDFSLAVIRRLRAGKSPFSADREHLHHRLLDMGHSHLNAVLIFYGWTIVVSVGALLFFVARPYYWAIVFLAVGLVACTAVTLSPLSRRKSVEAAVQRAVRDRAAAVAQFDPLDQAAAERGETPPGRTASRPSPATETSP